MKVICICSSASFYKDVVCVMNKLKKLGYEVLVPDTALKMHSAGDFDVAKHKVWLADESLFDKKRALIDAHFQKIIKSDAILVINKRKGGVNGYVGGNTLMEITVAYLHKKPIFFLNKPSKKLYCYEEVMCLGPVLLNGNLSFLPL